MGLKPFLLQQAGRWPSVTCRPHCARRPSAGGTVPTPRQALQRRPRPRHPRQRAGGSSRGPQQGALGRCRLCAGGAGTAAGPGAAAAPGSVAVAWGQHALAAGLPAHRRGFPAPAGPGAPGAASGGGARAGADALRCVCAPWPAGPSPASSCLPLAPAAVHALLPQGLSGTFLAPAAAAMLPMRAGRPCGALIRVRAAESSMNKLPATQPPSQPPIHLLSRPAPPRSAGRPPGAAHAAARCAGGRLPTRALGAQAGARPGQGGPCHLP